MKRPMSKTAGPTRPADDSPPSDSGAAGSSPEAGAAGSSPEADATLIDRCRGGDMGAFDVLVMRYQDRVFNTCWRMCGRREEAEDLTQEAFVRAFQSLDAFAGRSRFYTWVYRIAVNLTLSARRMPRNRPMHSIDAQGSNERPAMVESIASEMDAPDERADRGERERLVLEALETLDEEHRTVVVLRDLQALRYEEIAEILDVPTGTVKSRLHRGRLALRDRLKPLLGMED